MSIEGLKPTDTGPYSNQINPVHILSLYLFKTVFHISFTYNIFFLYGSTALYGPGPPRFVEVSWSHTF
jgi:hypothetical protein